MSAQALLSVIAPAIPVAPQGSSGHAASGFQSLLQALTADAALDGESGLAVTPALEDSGDAPVAPAGFLVAPPLLAGPLVVPAPTPAGDPAAGSTAVASAGNPAVDAAPQGTTPLPVDKVAPPKESDPPVQPVEPGLRRLERAPAGETQLTLAETAVMTEAAEARARVAGPLVAPTPQPQPQPQTLRPLAERTSKPVEATAVRSGEASGPDAIKPSAPASATAPAPTTAGQERPIVPEAFAAVLAADTSAAAEAEDRSADLPRTTESATAQTSSSGVARDASLSTLSRATIDATAQIAAQILRKLEGRSTRFEMALTPDELGRVDVKLDIDSEGRLNARLAFDNPLAATDMKGRVDDLRRQLEDAGFHLADDAFEFTDRDSGSSAFDRGQNARDGQSRAFAAASRLNADIDLAQPPRWLSLSLSPSGVDMKV